MRHWLAAAVAAGQAFWRHGGPDLAAALAFYGLFSVFPLLLLAGAALAYVLPPERLQAAAADLAAAYAPWARDAVRDGVPGLLAARERLGLAGALGLAWSGSHVFAALTRALDRIWPPPERRAPWLQRALGLAGAGGAVVLVAASALVAVAAALAGERLTGLAWGTGWARGVHPGAVATAVALLAGFLGILALYRWLPAAPPPWPDAACGALLAVALIHAARGLFARYVAGLDAARLAYGTVAGATLALAWLWVASTAVLLGAEFAAALSARRRGCRS